MISIVTTAMAEDAGKESPRRAAQRIAAALSAKLNARAAVERGQCTKPSVVAELATQNEPTQAPISSTVQATAYVSMLPYAYTNSDVAQLFSQFGKLARVTILRDKHTRKSRGVAFVQFARAEDCAQAVAEMHDTELEGFRLACSIVKDNGRSDEFQRKRKYTSVTPGGVSRCFECGEYGHFSYSCPRNVLGERERPVQKKKLKKKKKKGYDINERGHYFNDEGVVNLLAPPADGEEELSLALLAYPSMPADSSESDLPKTGGRKRKAVGTYFSDESASDGDD